MISFEGEIPNFQRPGILPYIPLGNMTVNSNRYVQPKSIAPYTYLTSTRSYVCIKLEKPYCPRENFENFIAFPIIAEKYQISLQTLLTRVPLNILLLITISRFPNFFTILNATVLRLVLKWRENITLQFNKAEILDIDLILLQFWNESRSLTQNIVVCNENVNKKFLEKNIKNQALLNCSPMSHVSYETDPSSLSLKMAIKFGKRRPHHFDQYIEDNSWQVSHFWMKFLL